MKLKDIFKKDEYYEELGLFLLAEDIYYNIKYGCINLIQWLPIVWKDRDYDYNYIYDLLEFKLRKMSKAFIKNDRLSKSKYYGRQLKQCADILKRLSEDEYINEAIKIHEKKWGEMSFESEPVSDELSRITTVYKNAKTDEEIKQAESDYKKCIKKSDKDKDRDFNTVFNKIKENILCWWY